MGDWYDKEDDYMRYKLDRLMIIKKMDKNVYLLDGRNIMNIIIMKIIYKIGWKNRRKWEH